MPKFKIITRKEYLKAKEFVFEMDGKRIETSREFFKLSRMYDIMEEYENAKHKSK